MHVHKCSKTFMYIKIKQKNKWTNNFPEGGKTVFGSWFHNFQSLVVWLHGCGIWGRWIIIMAEDGVQWGCSSHGRKSYKGRGQDNIRPRTPHLWLSFMQHPYPKSPRMKLAYSWSKHLSIAPPAGTKFSKHEPFRAVTVGGVVVGEAEGAL